MTKRRMMYEVRVFEGNSYSRNLGHLCKLRDRKRATKLKNYLVARYKMEAFIFGYSVTVK